MARGSISVRSRWKGLVSSPRWDCGRAGSAAERARSTANGTLISNSRWTAASSSGKTNPQPSQPSSSSGVQASVLGAVRPVGELAVGGVELGRDVGVEALDGRLLSVPVSAM